MRDIKINAVFFHQPKESINSIFRYKRPKRAVGALHLYTSSQHDDINIVSVSVARRRWTAPLKLRKTVFQAFYHILRIIKTRCTQGRLFYPQGPFFCALGPLFCALVREEAIFAHCKWCANEGFACMCNENIFDAYIMYNSVIELALEKIAENL